MKAGLACQVLLVGFLITEGLCATGGEPVIDEQLFSSLRDHYSGTWVGGMAGNAMLERLEEEKILIEVSGNLAEFLFYNMPKAQENFMYIPAVIGRFGGFRSWSNYFDRSSENVHCRMSSDDLRQDPFPLFQCKFMIDTDGRIQEGKNFHITPRNSGFSEADGYSRHVRSEGNEASFHFQIWDEAARQLYENMNIPSVIDHWGPIPVEVKAGEKIWCAKTSGPGYKCRIGFHYDGSAYQTYDEQ